MTSHSALTTHSITYAADTDNTLERCVRAVAAALMPASRNDGNSAADAFETALAEARGRRNIKLFNALQVRLGEDNK